MNAEAAEAPAFTCRAIFLEPDGTLPACYWGSKFRRVTQKPVANPCVAPLPKFCSAVAFFRFSILLRAALDNAMDNAISIAGTKM